MSNTEIIRELGGATAVAGLLGLKVSAITMWGTRGRIPAEHWFAVWRLALERGLSWTPPGAEPVVVLLRSRRRLDGTTAAALQAAA